MLKKEFNSAVKQYKAQLGEDSYDKLVANYDAISKHKYLILKKLDSKEYGSDIILAYGKVSGMLIKSFDGVVVFSKKGFYSLNSASRTSLFVDYNDITAVNKGDKSYSFVIEHAGKQSKIFVDNAEATATLLECIINVINPEAMPEKAEPEKKPTKTTVKKKAENKTASLEKEIEMKEQCEEERLRTLLDQRTQELNAVMNEVEKIEAELQAAREEIEEEIEEEPITEDIKELTYKTKEEAEEEAEEEPKEEAEEEPKEEPVIEFKSTLVLPNDFKTDDILLVDSKPMIVTEKRVIRAEKGGPIVVLDYIDVSTGKRSSTSFYPSEKVPKVIVDICPATYLYREDDEYFFMNSETFEQICLSSDMVGDVAKYIVDGADVTVRYASGIPLLVLPNSFVTLQVLSVSEEAEGNMMRYAEVETGATLKVPAWVKAGDSIKVDTRNGEYLETVEAGN